MFNFFKKSKKLLGRNTELLYYVQPGAKRIAQNKLLVKDILSQAGLPVLETYAIIKNKEELKNFDWSQLPASFVLKPNLSALGKGIWIIYGREKNQPNVWVKADKTKVTIEDLKNHIIDILEGIYSISEMPDVAFFEERAKVLKELKPYCFRGAPDVRIMVYNNIPVMAELRLPTEESGGRANLSAGGIGLGIDLLSGITTTAIQNERLIEYLPKTKIPLRGLKVPYWEKALELAIKAQQVTGIKFLGVDIVFDREKGPLILEVNDRPGLYIQIANLSPLKERLERVEGLKIKSVKKAIRLAQDLFGGEIEEELEEISGRKIIGINETIEIIDKKGDKHQIQSKIDTGAYRTRLSSELAQKLDLVNIIGYKKIKGATGFEEKAIVPLSFILNEKTVNTEAFLLDRKEMKADVIIGRRDLKEFLIDPNKNIR